MWSAKTLARGFCRLQRKQQVVRWQKQLYTVQSAVTVQNTGQNCIKMIQKSHSLLQCQTFSTSSSSKTEKKSPLPMDQVLSHLDIMEKWTCTGCGIDMQYEDEKKVGYFPKKLLENIHEIKDLHRLTCERCFQIKQYGKITDSRMAYHEYERRVMELRAKDMLMIQLVDILDISGSLLPKARHIFGKKPVMLVVNKGDLIPEKSGIRRLMRHIRNEAKAIGIDNIVAVYLISALKGIGMKEIIEDVKKQCKGRDVCVVGAANVGKSTFLNSFMGHLIERKWQHNHRKYMKLPEVTLEDLSDEESIALLNLDDEIIQDAQKKSEEFETKVDSSDEQLSPAATLAGAEEEEDPEALEACEDEDREVTTSPLPGTTLAVQSFPVMIRNQMCNILDTPGLITNSKRQKLIEILALDGSAQLKNVFPSKKLPVTTYRMQSGRSLFLGGLARFDYESTGGENDKNLVLFSWYGVLPGHLTKTVNADETFIKHAGGLLSPPRGLDALSYTGNLVHAGDILLKDYITKDSRKKSKQKKKTKRTSAVELEIPGFGWLSVTAVDLDGTHSAEYTLQHGKVSFHTCQGLSIIPRTPLFPYEMSTSKSANWKS